MFILLWEVQMTVKIKSHFDEKWLILYLTNSRCFILWRVNYMHWLTIVRDSCDLSTTGHSDRGCVRVLAREMVDPVSATQGVRIGYIRRLRCLFSWKLYATYSYDMQHLSAMLNFQLKSYMQHIYVTLSLCNFFLQCWIFTCINFQLFYETYLCNCEFVQHFYANAELVSIFFSYKVICKTVSLCNIFVQHICATLNFCINFQLNSYVQHIHVTESICNMFMERWTFMYFQQLNFMQNIHVTLSLCNIIKQCWTYINFQP